AAAGCRSGRARAPTRGAQGCRDPGRTGPGPPMTVTPLRLPAMSRDQELSWLALLDVADRLPSHWTLVGGQMVHLLCAERGAAPDRPHDDADTVVDIRPEPHMLRPFTGTLSGLEVPAGDVGGGPAAPLVEGGRRRPRPDRRPAARGRGRARGA